MGPVRSVTHEYEKGRELHVKRNKSRQEREFLVDRGVGHCSSWPAQMNGATRNERPPRVRFPLSLLLVSNGDGDDDGDGTADTVPCGIYATMGKWQ